MTSTASPASERRYVQRETLISAVINGLIGAAFFLVVFRGRADPALWGPGGLVLDCLPQGFMVGLMSVAPPVLLTRRRLARGAVAPSLGAAPRLPRHLLPLSLACAVTSMAGLTALAAALSLLSASESLPFLTALLLKTVASVVVTVLITPPVLRATLRRAPISI